MKKQISQDERVVAQRQKIQSEGFVIVFFVLLISSAVQSFFLNAPLEQYAVEFICFLGMSVYLLTRNIIIGNSIFGDSIHSKTIPLVNSLVTGIITTVIHGVLNYTKYSERYENNPVFYIGVLAVHFVSVTISVYIVLSLLIYFNKKRQAKIQKQLDEKEHDE